jgi:hypothetical protein
MQWKLDDQVTAAGSSKYSWIERVDAATSSLILDTVIKEINDNADDDDRRTN